MKIMKQDMLELWSQAQLGWFLGSTFCLLTV